MIQLLNEYLPTYHKVGLIVQSFIIVLIFVAIIVATITGISGSEDEMLLKSFWILIATVALLLVDNIYYRKVINSALYCIERACEPVNESERD